MRKLASVLGLAAALTVGSCTFAHAFLTPQGQAENFADPAACGSTACPTYHAELASFPFWDRLMTGVGTVSGSQAGGTYTWYGTVGQYGYVMASNHTGDTGLGSSYTFVHGPHAGQSFKVTSDVAPRNAQWLKLFRVEPGQFAPGCTNDGFPASCCEGYDLGDGTCSGSPACDGGGCTMATLPDMPPMPLGYRKDFVAGSTLMLVMSAGPATSAEREWYLECNSDVARGGLGGAPHACCTLEFTGAVSGVTPFKSPYLTYPTGTAASDGIIGGVGVDCDDPTPGYTYVGPLMRTGAEAQVGHWRLSIYGYIDSILDGSSVSTGVHQALPHLAAEIAALSTASTTGCWTGYPITGGSDQLSVHLGSMYIGHPRDGTRADCTNRAPVVPGDSGMPSFAYTGGKWVFIGSEHGAFGSAELMSEMRWHWWNFVTGLPLGRSAW